VTIVRDVSFTIGARESVASPALRAGKSTLLALLAGLDTVRFGQGFGWRGGPDDVDEDGRGGRGRNTRLSCSNPSTRRWH
jgi:predicted ABC-type transport system involved in lysophospholipase L1 biosynthesis ATPase subunit